MILQKKCSYDSAKKNAVMILPNYAVIILPADRIGPRAAECYSAKKMQNNGPARRGESISLASLVDV